MDLKRMTEAELVNLDKKIVQEQTERELAELAYIENLSDDALENLRDAIYQELNDLIDQENEEAAETAETANQV